MSIRKYPIAPFAFAVMTTVAACEQIPTDQAVDPPVAPSLSKNFDELGQYAAGLDRKFLEINREVPGFAGVIIDEGVTPVALLRDEGRQEELVAVLEPILKKRGFDAGRLRFRTVEFEWIELLRWAVTVRSLLNSDNVVHTYISEAGNHVAIGVEYLGASAQLAALLEGHGIPSEAVGFEEVDRPQLAVGTLRDRHRPIRGGVKTTPEGRPPCTVGPVVNYDGIDGFLTASHCTDVFGSVTGSVFHQPTVAASNRAGVEVVDPPFFSPADHPQCENTDNFACRFSDATLIEFDVGVSMAQGHIARPLFRGRWSGTLTIRPDRPRFWVPHVGNFPFVGQELNKVGQRTGWTYGPVSRTCVYEDRIIGASYHLICQDHVDAGAAPGDSGSPVFMVVGPSEARLYGVLWGAVENSHFVFSSNWALNQDFDGSFDMIGTPALAVSVTGPNVVDQERTYSWSVDAGGGPGNYQYQWRVEYQSGFGHDLGTGTSQSLYVSEQDGSFDIMATVTSGDEMARGSQQVTNSIGCPELEC